MKAYNAITVVCVLMMLAAGIGSAYAYYSATLTDDESVNVNNNYGTATLTEDGGIYTLSYRDTTADSVYLTIDVSGLSPDYASGTILDCGSGRRMSPRHSVHHIPPLSLVMNLGH